MTKRPAQFITFEGLDGAGKTSHVDAVEKALEKIGSVVRTREPGGTPLAESLRSMMLTQPMDPITESLLAFAGRRDHVVQVICPALQRGDLVLCDRFIDSTYAFQGGGRQVPWDVLQSLEKQVLGGLRSGHSLKPDLTVFFDVPVDVASVRLSAARVADRFESEHQDFHERVRKAYRQRISEDPDRFLVVNSNQPIELVRMELEHGLRSLGLDVSLEAPTVPISKNLKP